MDRPVKPPAVEDITAFWTNPPPSPSPRLEWWKARIAEGWRPNRRISSYGYYNSSEWYGVYIWEWINVLSDLTSAAWRAAAVARIDARKGG